MSSDYPKVCNKCDEDIIMSKRTGSWLPYDSRGEKLHSCQKKTSDGKEVSKDSSADGKPILQMTLQELIDFLNELRKKL